MSSDDNVHGIPLSQADTTRHILEMGKQYLDSLKPKMESKEDQELKLFDKIVLTRVSCGVSAQVAVEDAKLILQARREIK